MNKKFYYSVKDIYGKNVEELIIPKGYELTGEFRPINEELPSHWLQKDSDDRVFPTTPRLMLRKKTPASLSFTEGGRVPIDFFVNADMWFKPDESNSLVNGPYVTKTTGVLYTLVK